MKAIHIHVKVCPVINRSSFQYSSFTMPGWQQVTSTPTMERRYQMTPTDNMPRIKKSKCVVVERLHKANFWQACVTKAIPVAWFSSEPSYKQEIHSPHVAAIFHCRIGSPNVCVIDAKYPSIPVRTGVCAGFRRSHHDIGMGGWIDGVILALKIVCGVI
jgi:hypothetical protein